MPGTLGGHERERRVAGLLARDAFELVCARSFAFLWASGARSDRRERRRQGSSPGGRRPRSGLRGAGRGEARPGGIEPGARPQAGRSPTPRRTGNPGIGPSPKIAILTATLRDRKGDDGIREGIAKGRAARQASAAERGAAPAAASAASGGFVSVASPARKEPPVAIATSGSFPARVRKGGPAVRRQACCRSPRKPTLRSCEGRAAGGPGPVGAGDAGAGSPQGPRCRRG